ncbi:MAG: ion transporter, partial [Bacteroidales bacterium]|nr:ion transporter [Bacteroidales bacterium]
MEKLSKVGKIKQELNRVFDDDLHTKQWHNYLDYAIIGLIIISTIEVFLSTYSGIVERYGKWLNFVDWFTTIFFTIEVSLRIWCADLLDEKYKGFWGRVKY